MAKELTPEQQTRLRDSATEMAQTWLRGLTPPEREALGAHSCAALERQLGSAFYGGFKLARLKPTAFQAAAPTPPAAQASPAVPETPDAPPKTEEVPDTPAQASAAASKKQLMNWLKSLGAPAEYIEAHFGTGRRPRKETKQKVSADIRQASQDPTWVWPTATPPPPAEPVQTAPEQAPRL